MLAHQILIKNSEFINLFLNYYFLQSLILIIFFMSGRHKIISLLFDCIFLSISINISSLEHLLNLCQVFQACLRWLILYYFQSGKNDFRFNLLLKALCFERNKQLLQDLVPNLEYQKRHLNNRI